MKRLTERYKNGTVYNVSETKERAVDRLAAIEDILGDEYNLDRLRELAQADRERRCVVLPCMTHFVFGNGAVSEERFKLNYLELFGKTVFLDRADAEDALRREQDG